MVCPRCNEEVADGSKFCSHCGHSLAATRAETAAVARATRTRPPVSERRRGLGDILCAGMAVVVIVVGFLTIATVFGVKRSGWARSEGFERAMADARAKLTKQHWGVRVVLFLAAVGVGIGSVVKCVLAAQDRNALGSGTTAYLVVAIIAFMLAGLFCVRMRMIIFPVRQYGLEYVLNMAVFGLGLLAGLVGRTASQ
ncbi:MAG: zinc-ribbon domain-containing protein [Planctomycetes bacterium]|nr:zinc-ribbon domain-containing protein [Planctomycetota bacterium]MBM4084751.1 zinc-ribbon domain-containing protein [Planctomycetota bacterium]